MVVMEVIFGQRGAVCARSFRLLVGETRFARRAAFVAALVAFVTVMVAMLVASFVATLRAVVMMTAMSMFVPPAVVGIR